MSSAKGGARVRAVDEGVGTGADPLHHDHLSRLDRLVLEVLEEDGGLCPCDIVVGDDPDGALTAYALDHMETYSSVELYVASRSLRQATGAVLAAAERGLRERVAVAGVDGPVYLPDFFAMYPVEAEYVLTHLPKSLAELEYLARSVAHRLARRPIPPGTEGTSMTVIAGGNTKHMTRSQNTVLAGVAREVRASRGAGKFRCLLGVGVLPDTRAYTPPVTPTQAGEIVGVGGVFGGAGVDHGGRLLAETAIEVLRRGTAVAVVEGEPAGAVTRVLDLGCGNGQVSLQVLHALRDVPGLHVTATDVAADAVASAQRTLAPVADRATVTWDDAASRVADGSTDLVLLNPPFHRGTTIDMTMVGPLLTAAHRVLRPGGELLMVHNSHLRYRPELERRFGREAVDEVTRDPRFTVLRARA